MTSLSYYFVLIILLMRHTESTLISWVSLISSCFTPDSRRGCMTDSSLTTAYGGLTPHSLLVETVTDQCQSWNQQRRSVPAEPRWQTGKWIEKAWLAISTSGTLNTQKSIEWVNRVVGQKMLLRDSTISCVTADRCLYIPREWQGLPVVTGEGHCHIRVEWDFMAAPGFCFFTPVKYKAIRLRFALISQMK